MTNTLSKMKMNQHLFLQFLLIKLISSLYYLDRRGQGSETNHYKESQQQRFQRYQPPFQVIDRNLHKRRLDVWVPLLDDKNDKSGTNTETPEPIDTKSVTSKVSPVYKKPPQFKSKTSQIVRPKSSVPAPVYNTNDNAQRRSGNVQQEQYTNILNHLDNYKKNDKYNPNKKHFRSVFPTQKSKQKTKFIETAVTRLTSKPTLEKVAATTSTELQYQKRTPINIFPKIDRKDVVNILQTLFQTQKLVQRTMTPLAELFSRIANSFSLDLTRRQSVEEILDTDRQDSTPIINSVIDTVQFTINEVLDNLAENPQPPIIIATVLLSLVTGSVVGNSITDTARGLAEASNMMNETENADDEDDMMEFNNSNCPYGYELVYVGLNGIIYSLGNVMIGSIDIDNSNGMGNGIDRKSVV